MHDAPEFPLMSDRARKWAMFTLRWGVAVAGIWWVVSNMTLRDHVTILVEKNKPVRAMLASRAPENAGNFEILDPVDGKRRVIARQQTINPVDRKQGPIAVLTPQGVQQRKLLGLDLRDDLKRVQRFLVQELHTEEGTWVTPDQ